MKLTIYGIGYVGLVTGACMAKIGHNVLCVDIDANKISQLQNGQIPIHEPELEEIVRDTLAAGNLRFSCDAAEGVGHAKLQMIAVGTPPDESGAPNLSYLLNVARTIGRYMREDRLIINKSTVPVGTAELVEQTARDVLKSRSVLPHVEAVSNPEFLKEGSAVADFMNPDRIIIGAHSTWALLAMSDLYRPLVNGLDRLLSMEPKAAEMTKYAANAMLATKISFINEMSNLAERMGIDIDEVRRGIGSDPRIGPDFINPSCGFGGSCFPKDILGLLNMASREQYPVQLIEAVADVNRRQRQVLFEKIAHHFGGCDKLAGKQFALWGLAFKANTDDIRMSPAIELAETLLSAGATVYAYDPAANANARQYFADADSFHVVDDAYDCADGACALITATDWGEFRNADLHRLREILVEPTIFDGRNLYDPVALKALGMSYFGIGRGQSRFSNEHQQARDSGPRAVHRHDAGQLASGGSLRSCL